MERRQLERMVTLLQARARGRLVRSEVRRAREDFEGIVREIDGTLGHLHWRETVTPIPHFTDTDVLLLRPVGSASEHSDAGLRVGASSQSPAAASPSSEERGEDHLRPSRMLEAERDESLEVDCCPKSPARGDGEYQQEASGRAMKKAGESISTQSGLELNSNCSRAFKGPQKYCLAQDVPQTPEALRLHRNTLTMELLWLQQAIDSRKKYLSLKDNLSIIS